MSRGVMARPRRRMLHKLMGLLTLALLLAAPLWAGAESASLPAAADPALLEGQRAAVTYLNTVNALLAEQGVKPLDTLYELYPTFASVGLHGEDSAYKTAELFLQMSESGVVSLQLRVCDSAQFVKLAGACLAACGPAGLSMADGMAAVQPYADLVQREPANSFEESVTSELQGNQLRMYCAYFPNEYLDGLNWLQMTLIFPRADSSIPGLVVEIAPQPVATPEDAIEGYFSQDNYTHFELFVTPTPEPDSAAME